MNSRKELSKRLDGVDLNVFNALGELQLIVPLLPKSDEKKQLTDAIESLKTARTRIRFCMTEEDRSRTS